VSVNRTEESVLKQEIKVTIKWRKLHNWEHYRFFFLSDVIRVMRLSWMDYVTLVLPEMSV
jgi:hypothetical protein